MKQPLQNVTIKNGGAHIHVTSGDAGPYPFTCTNNRRPLNVSDYHITLKTCIKGKKVIIISSNTSLLNCLL